MCVCVCFTTRRRHTIPQQPPFVFCFCFPCSVRVFVRWHGWRSYWFLCSSRLTILLMFFFALVWLCRRGYIGQRGCPAMTAYICVDALRCVTRNSPRYSPRYQTHSARVPKSKKVWIRGRTRAGRRLAAQQIVLYHPLPLRWWCAHSRHVLRVQQNFVRCSK